MVHSNIVIRTLMSVSGVYFEYIGLCHKYQILNPYCSVSYIKHAIQCDFVKCVVLGLDVFAFIFLVLGLYCLCFLFLYLAAFFE